MESEMNIKVYHGTDKKSACSIIKNNFRLPRKPDSYSSDEDKKRYYEYWLGPGVYLFKDKKAAQWWAGKPSDTFGSAGDPAVLECCLCLTSQSVDLTLSEGVELMYSEYLKFIGMMKQKNGKVTIDGAKYKNMDEEAVIRSCFFRWFQKVKNIDILIANFQPQQTPYIPEEHKHMMTEIGLIYSEVQYCVFNVDNIKQKTIMEEN